MNLRNMFAVLCWVGLALVSEAYGRDLVVVIVHPSNTLHNLNQPDLANIYKGRVRQWQNSQSIYVINRPARSSIRDQFYQQALKTKATTKFYKPGSPTPFKTRVVKSDRAVRRFVARIPSAIGYIHASEVDDSIKVITINGLRFGHANYLLGERSHSFFLSLPASFGALLESAAWDTFHAPMSASAMPRFTEK